jgi:lipid-binding SYLF domain-containing protein
MTLLQGLRGYVVFPNIDKAGFIVGGGMAR